MVSSFTMKKKLMVPIGALCAALLIVWVVRMFFRPATHPPCQCENLPKVEYDEISRHPTLETLGPYLGTPVEKEKEKELKAFSSISATRQSVSTSSNDIMLGGINCSA